MVEVWIVKAGEPLPLHGGRRWRAGQMSAAFAARGARVTWWNSTFSHLTKTRLYERQTEIEIGDRETVVALHGPAYRRNLSVARAINHRVEAAAFRREAARRPRPDLIVAAMPTLDLAEAASDYAARHGVRFIVDVRDQWPDVFTWALPPVLQRAGPVLFAPLYVQLRRTLSRAAAITAVGPGVLAWAQRHAGRVRPHDQVLPLAYAPFNLDAGARADAMAWLRGLGLRRREKVLALTASLNARSCETMPSIIRAFRQSGPTDWRMVICGSGPLEVAMRDAAGDSPRVVMAGWQGPARVRTLLENATAGLIPYPRRPDFMGACGNKVGEYLGAGLPVLTSLGGETARVVEEGEAGWTYDTPADLVRLLPAVSPADLRRRSRAALRVFERDFGPDAIDRFADHALSLVRAPAQSVA